MPRNLALLILATACKGKDGIIYGCEDTATFGTEGDCESDCYSQGASDRMNLSGDSGAPTWDACITMKAGLDTIEASGDNVQAVQIFGYSDAPPTDAEVDAFILMRDRDGEIWQVYPGDELRTDAQGVDYNFTSPEDGGPDWTWSTGWIGVFSEWNECYPDCGYPTIGAEMYDSFSAQADTCESYDDSDDTERAESSGAGMDVCITFDHDSYSPPSPPPTADDCEAGSGNFQLMPLHYQDRNDDGLLTVEWRPLQVSGRKTLTAAATVTKISVDDTHGAPLRVIHKDQTYSFDDSDKVEVSSRGSTEITARRAKTFTRSQLRGEVQFVSEELDPTADAMFVNMTWTCPVATSVASTPAPDPLPQGYVIPLADIGCLYNQKVVVRPILFEEQTGYARLELYGMGHNSMAIPLVFRDAWEFAYTAKGFDIEGSFAVQADGKLKVDFTTISYRGTDQCDTGSYTFAKEPA